MFFGVRPILKQVPKPRCDKEIVFGECICTMRDCQHVAVPDRCREGPRMTKLLGYQNYPKPKVFATTCLA